MNRRFIYAAGIGAIAYISFLLLDLILSSLLRFLQTFASWYQVYGTRYAWVAATGVALLYLLWAAVFSGED
ncbi:MAG: hypothetical protein AAGA60_31015 [Cyanobacteria bacterium P01_E01_bin.42]